ncbi:hypothetical protein KUTeg_002152 [Tegillarca granosa]|uniref:Uncharacterized protein n=1 Tax=Tegillarca granosa TaxID=220873 RepID=A0ABQ9FXV3_TEGGR|nr:hypothetical protein KUTeg_002152 [Tegillarca granosa]
MNIKSMNKSKISIVRKRHMVNSLIKNAKKTDTSLLKVVKGLGFSQKFLKKVENLEDLEDRKKRKDALSEETTADVDGFLREN